MIAQHIEHTLIKEDADFNSIIKLCLEAWLYGFRSVVVRPEWVNICKDFLRVSKVKVVTILGFPYGLTFTPTNDEEYPLGLAHDIDILPNILDIKDKAYHDVVKVLSSIRKSFPKTILKLIVETGVFNEEEIRWLCIIADDLNFDYVKSNTGLYERKRPIWEDLDLLKKFTYGTKLKIKMAGGIKDYGTAKHLITAGADLIGTSAGIKLLGGEIE